MIRAFFDSNVLFSAMYSSKGYSHDLLIMAVRKEFQMVISIGKTLTVWFGDPKDELICEETGDEVFLMKDNSGIMIGFEKIN